VEIEQNSGTWKIFDTADIFTCGGVYSVTGSTATVVVPGDAVAQGLNTTYRVTENSAFFSTEEERVVIEDSATKQPLVIHKVFIPE